MDGIQFTGMFVQFMIIFRYVTFSTTYVVEVETQTVLAVIVLSRKGPAANFIGSAPGCDAEGAKRYLEDYYDSLTQF